MKKIYQFCVLLLLMLLSVYGFAQCDQLQISGTTTVTGGNTYYYSIPNASQYCTLSWWVQGGTINGISSAEGPAVNVKWNDGPGSGSLYVQIEDCGCPGTREMYVTIVRPPVTISGRITNSSGQGMGGVSIGETTTDSNGNYSITVNSGWSGTLTPAKPCTNFSPSSLGFNNVTTNQNNQNFIGNDVSNIGVRFYFTSHPSSHVVGITRTSKQVKCVTLYVRLADGTDGPVDLTFHDTGSPYDDTEYIYFFVQPPGFDFIPVLSVCAQECGNSCAPIICRYILLDNFNSLF